jgi:hypothetical protein
LNLSQLGLGRCHNAVNFPEQAAFRLKPQGRGGFFRAADGSERAGGIAESAVRAFRWRDAHSRACPAGQERQQLKIVVLAGFLLVGLVVVGVVLADVLQIVDQDGAWGVAPFVLGLNAISVAIAVAVVKYHLYDFDRIISRTLSYALVVGLLAAVYLGVVTGLQVLLTTDDPLVVAASTLVVAALFKPAHRRIQIWVDRRFNRSRYDAERVLQDFAGSLRDHTQPGRVVSGWVEVVTRTMQPSSVGVWVRQESPILPSPGYRPT